MPLTKVKEGDGKKTKELISIKHDDFDLESRIHDEEFNEIFQKFCIHIIDNDDKTAEQVKYQIQKNQTQVEELDKLEYTLLRRDDHAGKWYVVGINKTGGYEFSTWQGYDSQEEAVDSFQRIFIILFGIQYP